MGARFCFFVAGVGSLARAVFPVAIRLRTVSLDGQLIRVALCAAETDEMPGDVYLDDGDHYAIAAKYALDRQGQTITTEYPEEWAAMESQKKRDAREELLKWIDAGMPAYG
jgi:hypothetical protein